MRTNDFRNLKHLMGTTNAHNFNIFILNISEQNNKKIADDRNGNVNNLKKNKNKSTTKITANKPATNKASI